MSYALNGKQGNRDDGESETSVTFSGHGEGEAEVANALKVPPPLGASWSGGSSDTFVAGASVRRLTPTECERLQALPDGWTQLGSTPDSRRYAALGDAVTASVGEWVGRRLIACG